MILISPVPEEHLNRVWLWLNEFKDQTLDNGSPQTLEELIIKHRRDIAAGGQSYGLMVGDQLVGAVWVDVPGDEIGLGHLVFDRDALSSFEKLAAAKVVLKKMFSQGLRKITWAFFADNRPFHIFLRRLGATEEGVLRRHVYRGLSLVDVRLMASFPETL